MLGQSAQSLIASVSADCTGTSVEIPHGKDLSYSRYRLPKGKRVPPILGLHSSVRPPQEDLMLPVSSRLQLVTGRETCQMAGRGLQWQSFEVILRPRPSQAVVGLIHLPWLKK